MKTTSVRRRRVSFRGLAGGILQSSDQEIRVRGPRLAMAPSRWTEIRGDQQPAGNSIQKMCQRLAHRVDPVLDRRLVRVLPHIKCQVAVVDFRILVKFQRQLDFWSELLTRGPTNLRHQVCQLRIARQIAQHRCALGNNDIASARWLEYSGAVRGSLSLHDPPMRQGPLAHSFYQPCLT